MSEENMNTWLSLRDSIKIPEESRNNNSAVVLIYGLNSSFSSFFELSRREIVENKRMAATKLMVLKSIFIHIASFEVFYDLPPSRYSYYLNSNAASPETNQDGLNLVEIQSEGLLYISEIASSMTTGDTDEVQFNLNKLLAVVCDICSAEDVIALNCIEVQKPQVEVASVKIPEVSDFSIRKKEIKKSGLSEVIIGLKLGKSKAFKHISVKVPGETMYKFSSHDIITSFFRASNFLVKHLRDKDYSINYSEDLRQLLNESIGSLSMGYMCGNDLISASDMKKKMGLKGHHVNIGRAGVPVLMKPGINSLDDLFDHVHKH